MKTLIRVLLIVLLAASANADEKHYNVPIDDSPVYGPADAQVTIIEFLDFQ